MTYRLYYWPTLPGRGELVRVILEDLGADWIDVARAGDTPDFAAVRNMLTAPPPGTPPSAPPVLVHGDLVLCQSGNIALYLGQQHDRLPNVPGALFVANQLLATLADIVAEAHDTHHPLGKHLYYADQQEAAVENARGFTQKRMPKWFGYLDRVLAANGTGFLAGDAASVVDLYAFQVLDGLSWAFPNAWARVTADLPRVVDLHARIAARPRLAAYLASDRRMPYNNDGVFRKHPELDTATGD